MTAAFERPWRIGDEGNIVVNADGKRVLRIEIEGAARDVETAVAALIVVAVNEYDPAHTDRETIAAIEQLTLFKGASVTIFAADLDAPSDDRLRAIDCVSEWACFRNRRFYGATIAEAAAAAVKARKAAAVE